jgi:phosphoglycerate dehydrogenase-like enzyme
VGRPLVLLWLDDAEVYVRAAERAGLASRVELQTLKTGETPDPAVWARAEGALAWRIPRDALGAAPRLRWVQALTAGVEGWLDRGLQPGLTLTCARGTHRVQMPENILGALFHVTKPFAAALRDQGARRWTRRVSEPLAGKTLGILGLGAIGQEVARKAAALELTVIGTRREAAPVPHVARVFPPDGTAEVLGTADFVLLLLPVTPATRAFMNARRLREMRPTAWLLNYGRGELVVDADLVDAVKQGVIAGAVLDVFRTEPLPDDHPFWTTPGITVLPHFGGLHPTRDELVAQLFVDNLRRFLDGEPLRHVVDRARGY